MGIEIGAIRPTSTPEPSQPILGDVSESDRRAEELGLDSIWSTDHLVAGAPILDGTIVLGAAAGATGRIKLGFGVMLSGRVPWITEACAEAQAAPDGSRRAVASRCWMGPFCGRRQPPPDPRDPRDTTCPAAGGVGGQADRFPAGGVRQQARPGHRHRQPRSRRPRRARRRSVVRRPGRRTDEALRRLPGLVGGKPTDLGDGLEVTLSPPAPMPPVMIVGNGARAPRRAADRRGPRRARGRGRLRRQLGRHGDLPGRAGHTGRAGGRTGPPRPGATVVGPPIDTDPAQAAEQLAAYAAAGPDRVVPAPTGPDWRRDHEFAAAVRPAVRARGRPRSSPAARYDVSSPLARPGGVDEPLTGTQLRAGRSVRAVSAGSRCLTDRDGGDADDAVHGDYQVFLGRDVGADGHHLRALKRDGAWLHEVAFNRAG